MIAGDENCGMLVIITNDWGDNEWVGICFCCGDYTRKNAFGRTKNGREETIIVEKLRVRG